MSQTRVQYQRALDMPYAPFWHDVEESELPDFQPHERLALERGERVLSPRRNGVIYRRIEVPAPETTSIPT